MQDEITYCYRDLTAMIPKANRQELRDISDIIAKERRLYCHFTFDVILRSISKRLLELGAPGK